MWELKFLRKWEDGYEVVYGVREKRAENIILTLFRNFFYSFLRRFSDIDIPNKAGDFRIVDRKVIDYLKKFDERNLYLRGLISFIGFKQCGIKYNRDKRFSGTSKISIMRYLNISLSAITSFTNTFNTNFYNWAFHFYLKHTFIDNIFCFVF